MPARKTQPQRIATAFRREKGPFAVLALLLVALLQVPVPAHPSVNDASIGDAPLRVVFGADHDYPPFAFVDKRGQPRGFDVELFRAVAAGAGMGVEVHLDRWDDVLAGLSSGKIDVVPMLVSEERRRRFHFSKPFLHRYHLVFAREGAAHVDSIEKLQGARVAVQVAGMAWEEIQRVPAVRLVEVAAEGDALVAVGNGAADYALVPMFIGYEAMQRHGLQDLVAASPPLLEREYAFGVADGSRHLLPRINAGLEQAMMSGQQDRIYLHWLANLTPPEERYRSGLMLGLYFAGTLLAIAMTLLVWWRRARISAAAEASSRVRAESRARHLALHDPVTQLPNRSALLQSLEREIASGRALALVRLELLEIDTVAAIAGHDFLDRLMLVLAGRLRKAHEPQLIAGLGHSGFLLAFPDVRDAEGAARLMRSLIQLVHARSEVSEVPLEHSCCAGAALFPIHAANSAELVQAASIACAAARGYPGSGVVFEPSLAPDARNLTLLADLRSAIRDGELGHALQPKIELRGRRITGAELLVRWHHPQYGALPPDTFVPLAEKTRVIGEMTLFLVRKAVAHCRRPARTDRPLRIAVNVSVNDLADSVLVDEIIAATEGVAHCLTVEITETAVMREPAKVLAAVQRLRETGVQISLDDFGTGHSSLTYLRQLAPDEVKIDRSFIAGLFSSAADQSIVRSTIQLAHSMGATVTAEGVEDARTLEWLAAAGCDAAQGFHLGRPMPPDEFWQTMSGASDA